MPLSLRQLEDVCLIDDDTHKKCRYLAQDDLDLNKYYCTKKSSKRADIDAEVSLFISETIKRGGDPYSENIPLGDNCPGLPVLKHIEQGLK